MRAAAPKGSDASCASASTDTPARALSFGAKTSSSAPTSAAVVVSSSAMVSESFDRRRRFIFRAAAAVIQPAISAVLPSTRTVVEEILVADAHPDS